MPPVEFEPTISAGEQPETHALDRAAPGTGEAILIHGVCRTNMLLVKTSVMCLKYWSTLQSIT
jgi:hypothetical protein